MATTISARPSVDYAGDEWMIVQYIKEMDNKFICRLRSKNRATYTEGDVGSRPVETVACLDKSLVVKAALDSAAMRSGLVGISLFGKTYRNE